MSGANACPTPGCGNGKRRNQPFCTACWRAMPKHMRLKVRAAHANGQRRALRRFAQMAAQHREARFFERRVRDTAQRP